MSGGRDNVASSGTPLVIPSLSTVTGSTGSAVLGSSNTLDDSSTALIFVTNNNVTNIRVISVADASSLCIVK